jgi:uncharacterized protein (DUF433 family)
MSIKKAENTLSDCSFVPDSQTHPLDPPRRAGEEAAGEVFELVEKCRLDVRGIGWQGDGVTFPELDRITFDPAVMGGKPCIRGMRVTVGMILGLIASGAERAEILRLYPYLEAEDLSAALAYGSWRAEERELPMGSVR